MRKTLVCIAALLAAAPAAASTLTLEALAADQQYQQITNNPCVIGENSCQQPAGFAHTILDAGNANSYDAVSPNYTVAFLRSFFGNVFIMGFDVNQATAAGSGVQQLSSFQMLINGSVVDSVTFNPAALVPPTAGGGNGNGYADYLITGFSSLLNRQATDLVSFRAILPSVNDGAEQFFLIDATDPPPPPDDEPPDDEPPDDEPPTPVPEPATLLMLGAGLAMVARRFRR